jgi:peptidoglycan L-alanyl-D-glutamate endopeptidase CwlK
MKTTKMFKEKQKTKPVQSKVYDWHFGKRSEMKMEGVEPTLIQVARVALPKSPIDFGITCGLRSQHEQNQLLAQGKTQVRHSRHQDGMAIDVVAYENGKVSWKLKHYITIADAFAEACKELNMELRWGAGWPFYLGKHTGQESHDAYVAMKRKQKRRTFIDGPHFEIPKE